MPTTIDVDFDVYKELTNRRATESVTYNDVIRELLGLNMLKTAETSLDSSSPQDWVVKDVRFPVDTEFRANYKGKIYTGRVESCSLVVNGKIYDSPSAAAMAITKTQVNGWKFWECRLPNKATWQFIERLRPNK